MVRPSLVTGVRFPLPEVVTAVIAHQRTSDGVVMVAPLSIEHRGAGDDHEQDGHRPEYRRQRPDQRLLLGVGLADEEHTPDGPHRLEGEHHEQEGQPFVSQKVALVRRERELHRVVDDEDRPDGVLGDIERRHDPWWSGYQ